MARAILDPSPRAALVLSGAVALACAAPLALSRYFPGSDLPWHVAIIEILRAHDPAREFLGYFTPDLRFSSYLTLYAAVLGLAALVGDTAIALEIVIALYAVAFVAAALYLARAFGGRGLAAILAAPAIYSETLCFGFLTYALTYPMTLFLWGLAREHMTGTRRAALTLAGGTVTAAAIALTHPFAAAIALAGAAVIVATSLQRATSGRAASMAVAIVLAMLPAGWAVMTASSDPAAQSSAGVIAAGPFDQVWCSPGEALGRMPERLFGFFGAAMAWATALVGLALAWLAGARRAEAGKAAGPGAEEGAGEGAEEGADEGADEGAEQGATRRSLAWLAIVLLVLYLVTPYTFEWPRTWYGAQPRLLPLLWVVTLVVLETTRQRLVWRLPGGALAACAYVALVLAVLVHGTFAPFAREASDFRAVVAEVPARVRTLVLVEQARALEREPPDPWRNAGAYVLVARHGMVSGLPFTDSSAGNAGMLVPVRLADHAPPVPLAPPPGFPRSFSMERHGAGWDFILIRDSDATSPFDYFRDRAGEVRQVATRGRWRLYQVAARDVPR